MLWYIIVIILVGIYFYWRRNKKMEELFSEVESRKEGDGESVVREDGSGDMLNDSVG
jgi:hypothetical protein